MPSLERHSGRDDTLSASENPGESLPQQDSGKRHSINADTKAKRRRQHEKQDIQSDIVEGPALGNCLPIFGQGQSADPHHRARDGEHESGVAEILMVHSLPSPVVAIGS